MLSREYLSSIIQQHQHQQQQQQQVQQPASCNEITKCLTIPDELVGCIIGRGGSKINSIRQESQAFIKIADAEEGTRNRRITIKGNPSSVNAAIAKINHTVNLHQQIVQMNLAIDIANSQATN